MSWKQIRTNAEKHSLLVIGGFAVLAIALITFASLRSFQATGNAAWTPKAVAYASAGCEQPWELADSNYEDFYRGTCRGTGTPGQLCCLPRS